MGHDDNLTIIQKKYKFTSLNTKETTFSMCIKAWRKTAAHTKWFEI